VCLTSIYIVSGQILVFALHISETKEISRALNREFSTDKSSAWVALDSKDQDCSAEMFCAALHGDMTTFARRSTLDSFRTGKIRVLVCTDVASRGLDVELGNSAFSIFPIRIF
jgi:superfamily II DNA/RNA helicase